MAEFHVSPNRSGNVLCKLFSARSVASLHVISMHRMSWRIVSCQFFRGLPLLRFPSGLRHPVHGQYSPSLSIHPRHVTHRSLLLLLMNDVSHTLKLNNMPIRHFLAHAGALGRVKTDTQLKLHKPTMAIGYSLRMCARHVNSTNPGRSNLVFRSKPIAEAEMSNRLI